MHITNGHFNAFSYSNMFYVVLEVSNGYGENARNQYSNTPTECTLMKNKIQPSDIENNSQF